MCSLQTQKVCGVHGPPYPAHLAARRPRLRAGRRGRAARSRAVPPAGPRVHAAVPEPKSPRPAQGPSGPQPPRAPDCSQTSAPRPPAPSAPRPLYPEPPAPLASADPAPSLGGLPEAQARSPASPVAVSALGRPTQPGQLGDSAERCTVRDRSSSSEPAGPRRKRPLAPPTRRSRRRLDLVRGRAGTGPRAIGEGGDPSRRPGPPPSRRLPSGGSVGRRRAGQSGPYCCCVIGARRRPLAATPGTARRARAGQGEMDSGRAPGEAASLGVTVGSGRQFPRRRGNRQGLRGAGILGRGDWLRVFRLMTEPQPRTPALPVGPGTWNSRGAWSQPGCPNPTRKQCLQAVSPFLPGAPRPHPVRYRHWASRLPIRAGTFRGWCAGQNGH